MDTSPLPRNELTKRRTSRIFVKIEKQTDGPNPSEVAGEFATTQEAIKFINNNA